MRKPDLGLAYVLLLLGGFIGAHRMYAGKRGSGAFMFLMPIASFALVMLAFWESSDGTTNGRVLLAASIPILANVAMWILDFFRMEELVEQEEFDDVMPRRGRVDS